ncbi:MAG: HAD hydrolase-like protein [Deltaproteobacteria bacterium]|nr:HAD hydrolase-like protein [Deltaproteobacteria bacterium]
MNKDLFEKYLIPLSPLPTSLNQSGKLDKRIKCILFDVYGTLFMSGSGDIGTAKKILQETDKIEHLLNKFKLKINAKTLLNNFFHTVEKQHEKSRKKGIDYPEIKIDEIWMRVIGDDNLKKARAFALEFELIVNPAYPMPHLKQILRELKNKHITLGIISNAQFFTPYLFDWFLKSDLKHLGFEPNLILFSYKFGYAKPSSFLFEVASSRLNEINIQTDSVLYVGNDMLNDIYPAQKTGFITGLFAGDARSLRLRSDEPVCENLSADIVITDLIQLLDYLD